MRNLHIQLIGDTEKMKISSYLLPMEITSLIERLDAYIEKPDEEKYDIAFVDPNVLLLKDESSGLMTALFQWEAGARIPLHEHVNIEQSYVIEGSLSDSEGECKSGHFAWRPAGSQHDAWSKEGCLVLAFLLKPNKFLEGPDAN